MADQAVDVIVDNIQNDYASRQLQVPSLPEVVMRIRDAVNNEDRGITDMANVIHMDPALTARLIQIANTPLYFSGTPVTDIRQAILRMGMSTIRNIVTCLVMHNIFKVESQQMRRRIEQLWQHSRHVAAVAQVIAGITPRIQHDKALLSGLLHDIGVLPILIYADGQRDIDVCHLDEVIRQLRGPLGQQILQEWNISDGLDEIPLHADDWYYAHDSKLNYVDIVIIAQAHCLLGTEQAQEIPSFDRIPALQKHTLSQMGPGASLELIHQAQTDIKRTMRMLNA